MRSASRWFLASCCAAAVAAGACRRAEPPSPERAVLLRTDDPVAASAAVTALARGSCAALTEAMAALEPRSHGQHAFAPADFDGLIEDAVSAAQDACPRAQASEALGSRLGAATGLARAHLLRDRPADALDALALAPPVAPVRRRRAQLLLALERYDAALTELASALAYADDPAIRAQLAWVALRTGSPARALAVCGERNEPALRRARAAALAALGRHDDAAAEVAAAPLNLRREVARATVSAAADVGSLAAVANAPVELVIAAAEQVTADDAAAAARLYARAASLDGDDADVHTALANVLEQVGDIPGAIEAWDRAAALAPAAQQPALAPIRLLATRGQAKPARARATAIAARARASRDADALSLASAAAAAANDNENAVALARAAVNARPGDGQLIWLLATRLERSGQPRGAAAVLSRLLVCGAHGRPWHRHELAGQLASIARKDPELVAGAVRAVDCEPVDADDLKRYVEALANAN